MRLSTLKWIVLSATLLAALIVTVQLYWLKKVYSFEERQFNTNVVKSIRGLFEDLEMNDAPGTIQTRLINNPDNNYFVFKADTIPPKDSLSFYLQEEFADFGVLTDCKLGAYSSTDKKFVYEEYIPTAASRYAGITPTQDLPVFTQDYDHILLFFPHRHEYILEQMNFWIISSVALFIALIGLAISLFYFYRQKFLAEIQKDFVNNFTHEFRTPLAVMKIASDVLAHGNIVRQPDRLERYAIIIQNQTEHLQGQVERLLKAASSESRNLPIQKELIEAHQLIEQALSKVQPLIEEKHAKVEVKIQNAVVPIQADRAHLELAIVNLLENALKYSSLHPHIVVETGNGVDDFFISVKDNGVGIEKKYLKNIFKKFYRIPTGDIHNVKGFGLGLNFVKRIIDAHNGKIKVNSLPGIGTEFRLFIPYN
jgi:two-component system phosphate regulon sensor histidine kinase PhoR